MAYQTLYRKYRPKTFELVFGQDTIVKTLKNVIKNKKLSHAYLFTGPRGTGKTSSAKLFAKTINCLNNQNGDACNKCENCKSFNENNNPDIIEIDAASNNGVDEIREIKNKVNLVPSMSKYKVYIIDEVHMLSIGAFNALLKTLEEPPEYIIFILATTEPQKIPATIISRCQRFDFKNISHDKMKSCLQNIIKKENIKIEELALEEIINNSNGGMRDAIGLLDQAASFSDDMITLKDIDELSGNINNEEINNIFNNILNKNYEFLFNKIKEYSSLGKDFLLICEKMINFVRKGILFKKNIHINEVSKAEKEILDKLSDSKLYMMIDFLSETLIKIKNNYQKELTFEVQMIQLIDKISSFSITKSNVPRETSKNTIGEKDNVPRETLDDHLVKKSYVPRETLKKTTQEKNEKLLELKKIRINNILKEATKQDMKFITDLWTNINEYLTNDKYKISAGILIDAKPVAVSKKGIIITLPLESAVNRIENEYDNSKELLKIIYNEEYKIVYITEEYWQKVRPHYVEKKKNGDIEFIDEKEALQKMRKSNLNNNSYNDFSELIEMEEK